MELRYEEWSPKWAVTSDLVLLDHHFLGGKMAVLSIQPITRLRRKLQQQPSFLLRRNPLFLRSPLQRPFAPTIGPLHHQLLLWREQNLKLFYFFFLFFLFFLFKGSNSKGSREPWEAVWSWFLKLWLDHNSNGSLLFWHRPVLKIKRTAKMSGSRLSRSDRTVRSGFQNLAPKNLLINNQADRKSVV